MPRLFDGGRGILHQQSSLRRNLAAGQTNSNRANKPPMVGQWGSKRGESNKQASGVFDLRERSGRITQHLRYGRWFQGVLALRCGCLLCYGGPCNSRGRRIQPAAAGDKFKLVGLDPISDRQERDPGGIGQERRMWNGFERLRKPLELRLSPAIEFLLSILPCDQIR